MPEAVNTMTLANMRAEADSRALRDRMRWAIKRQAEAWGIRPDQAQALLLDRKAIA